MKILRTIMLNLSSAFFIKTSKAFQERWLIKSQSISVSYEGEGITPYFLLAEKLGTRTCNKKRDMKERTKDKVAPEFVTSFFVFQFQLLLSKFIHSQNTFLVAKYVPC